jgi:hypothetical protein
MLFDRQAKLAFIIACGTLALCGIGFRSAVGYLNVYLEKEPVELRRHLATIPRTLGRWQAVGEVQPLTEAVIETLGTRQYLDRFYVLEGDPNLAQLSVHIAYYTGMIDAVPHVPDRCFVAGAGLRPQMLPADYPLALEQSDWQEDPAGLPYPLLKYADLISGGLVTVRMPAGEFKLRTSEFQREDRPEARIYGGYLFIANGRTTATPERIRLLAFKKSEKHAYYCKVQFIAVGGRELEVQPFLDQVSDLLSELLPELMRCLPDWAEVQGRSMARPST